MKLPILMSKIRVDFLQNAKTALNIELSRVPMNLTYEDALILHVVLTVIVKFVTKFLSSIAYEWGPLELRVFVSLQIR